MYDNLFFFTTPGYKVFAGNISYDVTKEELKEFFSDCGGEIKKNSTDVVMSKQRLCLY